MRIALVAITGNGARLARRLRDGLGGVLHVSRRYVALAGGGARAFEPGDLKELLATLWRENDALVCIMASGIVVRMIAPLVSSKESDPAVVVMDEAGAFAISLLSGHLGGANELAGRCASLSGGRPVITTATDVNGLPSFDTLAKELGLVIDDLSAVKTLNRLLLDEGRIAVVDHGGELRRHLGGRLNVSFHGTFSQAIASAADGFLFVTNRHLPAETLPPDLLVLRPRNLVLGIGCNRNTPAEEIGEFVREQLGRIFLSGKSVCRVATANAKRDEAGLLEFARRQGVEIVFYASAELNRVEVPSRPSPFALAAIGANGVAEPAALLASGGGRLLLRKVKSANVTLAVAELGGAGHG